MSRLPRIHYVVEGATDFIVLDAIVERLLGTSDYVYTRRQPPTSAVVEDHESLSEGWKGVLKWCEIMTAAPGGFAENALENCDCLIIHIDADIANERDLAPHDLSAPCPPAKDACDQIRNHLTALLGGNLPAKVVLCVPAQCTEAWVIAALHPDLVATYDPIECRKEPHRLLIQQSDRLVRVKAGKPKKQTENYREVAPRIAARWPDVVAACGEAKRFEEEFAAAPI